MRLIVNMPNSLYANLTKIVNGSIAGKRILECVKHGEPYKVDVLDKIRAEIEEQVLESLSDGGDDWFAAEKVNNCLEIIDKYREGEL